MAKKIEQSEIAEVAENFVVPERKKEVLVAEILGKMSELTRSKHGGRDARPNTRRQ